MKDFIVLLIVAIIIVLVAVYVYRSKKKGKKCIGCPYADICKKNSCLSCNGKSEN